MAILHILTVLHLLRFTFHVTFLLAGDEGFSTSLPIIVICLFDYSRPCVYEVIFISRMDVEIHIYTYIHISTWPFLYKLPGSDETREELCFEKDSHILLSWVILPVC